MKTNPGRKERRNLYFAWHRQAGQIRAKRNEHNMQRAARKHAKGLAVSSHV